MIKKTHKVKYCFWDILEPLSLASCFTHLVNCILAMHSTICILCASKSMHLVCCYFLLQLLHLVAVSIYYIYFYFLCILFYNFVLICFIEMFHYYRNSLLLTNKPTERPTDGKTLSHIQLLS